MFPDAYPDDEYGAEEQALLEIASGEFSDSNQAEELGELLADVYDERMSPRELTNLNNSLEESETADEDFTREFTGTIFSSLEESYALEEGTISDYSS